MFRFQYLRYLPLVALLLVNPSHGGNDYRACRPVALPPMQLQCAPASADGRQVRCDIGYSLNTTCEDLRNEMIDIALVEPSTGHSYASVWGKRFNDLRISGDSLVFRGHDSATFLVTRLPVSIVAQVFRYVPDEMQPGNLKRDVTHEAKFLYAGAAGSNPAPIGTSATQAGRVLKYEVVENLPSSLMVRVDYTYSGELSRGPSSRAVLGARPTGPGALGSEIGYIPVILQGGTKSVMIRLSKVGGGTATTEGIELFMYTCEGERTCGNSVTFFSTRFAFPKTWQGQR